MSVFGPKGANLLKVALLAAVILAACLLLALGSNEEALATPGDLDPTFDGTAPAGTVARSVDAGDYHTCGVRTGGTVACWGYNATGESSPPAGTFTAVSAGNFHSCGVKTDGTIVCWGSNDHGQTDTPSGTFSAVSVGLFHNCAVKTDGIIACWGDNGAGQLGAAPADPSPAPPAGQVGTAYSHTFTSSAGSPVGSFSVSAGALPPGLTLSSGGVLSGTPTAGGEYTFTVTASNDLFADASQQFTIIVSSGCTIGEILPPVNDVSNATDGGMSAYKYGSRGVIPAKFRAACNGNPVDTQAEADAYPMTLTLTKLGSTPAEDVVVESTETGSADTGNLFRFDDAADQYIYTVGVKGLGRGTYKITISEANGGGSHDEWFSVK